MNEQRPPAPRRSRRRDALRGGGYERPNLAANRLGLTSDGLGLVVRLLDQLAGAIGKLVLDGLECRVDAVQDRLDGAVHLFDPLRQPGQLVLGGLQMSADRVLLLAYLLEDLLTVHLGSLKSENSQANKDVCGVPGGLRDRVGYFVEIGHLHSSGLSEPGVTTQARSANNYTATAN